MNLTTFACPHCEAVLKSPAGVPVGKKISCPKCHEPFAVSIPGPTRKAPPADEGKENGADIPPRKKKRKPGKRRAAPSLLLLAVIVGVGVLLLAGGGIGLYFTFRKAPAADPSPSDFRQLEKSGGSQPLPRTSLPGWQEILSGPGRFQAMMPSPVVERVRTMPSPVGSIQDYQYLHEASGENLGYSIVYADFSETQLQKRSLQQIIDAGRDEMLKSYRGQVETDRRIERAGRLGREVVIHVPSRGRFLMRYFIDRSRLYTLLVVGPKAALDAKEAQAFFDSFHFADTKRQ